MLAHQEEQALLKAYIAEWRKFFTQCNYLPTPFRQLEPFLAGKNASGVQKKTQPDESIVRKVSGYIMNVFNLAMSLESIFSLTSVNVG